MVIVGIFYFWQIVDGRDMRSHLELPVEVAYRAPLFCYLLPLARKNACTVETRTHDLYLVLLFCWAAWDSAVQTGLIPGPDPPLFILESRVLWWPLYYDVTSCSADGNFEVTLATKATLMASGKGAVNKLRLPTFITMPLAQKFSLQNCAICWLGKELPWQNGLAHVHFMKKTCLMSGSSHILSVLIGVEYRNCCWTLDVYLLFAILLGQIKSKVITYNWPVHKLVNM